MNQLCFLFFTGNFEQVDSGDSKKLLSKKMAEHFAQEEFLSHPNGHVRALMASILAAMFRIFVGTEDDEMGSQDIPSQMGPLSDVGLLEVRSWRCRDPVA
jgi:hypothetical protein